MNPMGDSLNNRDLVPSQLGSTAVMRKLRDSIRKRIVYYCTFASIIFVIWNTCDEYYVLGSFGDAAIIVAMWLAMPGLNVLIFLFVPAQRFQQMAIVMSVLYMLIFSFFAFNGSTSRYEVGAQHMHLLLVPVLLTLMAVLLLIVGGTLSAWDWARQRKRQSEASG
jgi:hypothetical protein